MAIIVEFPDDRETNRYARKFGNTTENEAEILLFTGVQYERSSSVENKPRAPIAKPSRARLARPSRQKKRQSKN